MNRAAANSALLPVTEQSKRGKHQNKGKRHGRKLLHTTHYVTNRRLVVFRARFLLNGFAARCEEAAMPFRQRPSKKRAAPRWGIAPRFKNLATAGQSHRLTS